MSLTDILILTCLILYFVLGFRDGFFKKVFGILGFWIGLVCATKFMGNFGAFLKNIFNFSDIVSYIIAFFLIFSLISIGMNLFYRWYGSSGVGSLKFWSRLGGAFLGIIQGTVTVSLILLMLNLFQEPSEEERKNSILYKPLYDFVPLIFDYSTKWIPESKAFLEEIDDIFKGIEKQ